MASAPRPFLPIPLGKWPGPAVAAIKALSKGEARPDQQLAAVNFLIEELCGLYNEPFRPDEMGGERETSFALGAMFVGREIRKCIAQPFEKLVGKTATVSKEQE